MVIIKKYTKEETISFLLFVFWSLAFLIMSIYRVSRPGIHYDETLFINAALGAKTDHLISKRIFGIPFMVTPYIGALKAYIYMPVFWLFGVSARSIRIPMILLGIVTLWFTYRLVNRLTKNLWVSNIVVALFSTSLCFIVSSKMDWGPTSIMMFLMVFALWVFFRLLDTHRLLYFYVLLGVLLLGMYDKSNFIWFSSAFGVSALVIYRKEFMSVIRELKGRFTIPLVIFLNIIYLYITFSVIPLMRLDLNSASSVTINLQRVYDLYRGVNDTLTGTTYTGYMLGKTVEFSDFKNTVTFFSFFLSLVFLGLNFIPYFKKRFFSDMKEFMDGLAFLCLISGIIFLEMVLTRQAGGPQHFIMLLPYTVFVASLCGYTIVKIAQSGMTKKIFAITVSAVAAVILVFNLSADIWFLRHVSDEKSTYNPVWDPAIYELSGYVQNAEFKNIYSTDWGLLNQLHALDPDRDQKRYLEMAPYFDEYNIATEREKDVYSSFYFNEDILFIGHGLETTVFKDAPGGFEEFQRENGIDAFQKVHSIENNQGLELYDLVKYLPPIQYTGFHSFELEGGRWISSDASIIWRDRTASYFSLKGFCPDYLPDNSITVTINNKESVTKEMVPGNPFEVEMYFENSLDYVTVDIKTDTSFIPKELGLGGDTRELGAFIISWYSAGGKYNGFHEAERRGGWWITGNSSIVAKNRTATYFSLSGFYPEYMTDNRITVAVNDKESVTIDMLPGNYFDIELEFENTLDYVTIDLKTDRSFIPQEEGWSDDNRELAAFISSWSISDEKYEGFHKIEPDGWRWITGNASIVSKNRAASHFSLKGSYPHNWPANSITVTINNKESVIREMVPGDPFELELDFDNTLDFITVDIKTDKTFIPEEEGWGTDDRELGAIVTSWSFL